MLTTPQALVAEVMTVLDMFQAGTLTAAQAIAVLMIDTGRWERSGESLLVGTAVDLAASGKLDVAALSTLVDAFPATPKAKVYSIVVENPQADPDHVTFTTEGVEVEEISLSTYYVSQWNTSELSSAIDNINGWIHEALHHEDERVRGWFRQFTVDNVPDRYKVDWTLGRVTAYAEDEYDFALQRHVTKWKPVAHSDLDPGPVDLHDLGDAVEVANCRTCNLRIGKYFDEPGQPWYWWIAEDGTNLCPATEEGYHTKEEGEFA